MIDNQGKNKMNEINITRLLGPTLMTVDGDEVSPDSCVSVLGNVATCWMLVRCGHVKWVRNR